MSAEKQRASPDRETFLAASGRPGSNRGGGPRLDASDWVILLDIFLRNKGEPIGESHHELVAASELLSRRAGERGRPRPGANLRSTHGLARRMTVLRSLERGDERALPREAVLVWRRYASDPAGCSSEAMRISGSTLRGGLTSQSPSRGPAPFAGTYFVEQECGPSSVYLMELRGRLPNGLRGGKLAFLKVGRSSHVGRREAELNAGFPPGLGLLWTCIFSRSLPDAQLAHDVEQAVLGELTQVGATIGGEFLRHPSEEVRKLIERTVDALLQQNHLPGLPRDATKPSSDGSGANYE